MSRLTPLTRDDTEHGKTYYLASEVDALLDTFPTRESVADDIGVLLLNGDLPANMEGLADWVQTGRMPVDKLLTTPTSGKPN